MSRTSMMRVYLYDPQNDSSGRVNKMVASADGPFCHCELQFTDGQAFTIYMHGVAVLRPRRFSSPNYTCLAVPCTHEQQVRCREFAAAAVERVPFSTLRMVNAFCRLSVLGTSGGDTPPHPLAHAAHGSFCSELVTEALQAGGVLPASVAARHVTPSGLARLLQGGGAERVERTATQAQAVAPGRPSPALGFKGGVTELK